MAVSHVKNNTVADMTGTVTVFNSAGVTATVAATDLVRPGDWNSAHNQYFTATGANTISNTTASGTNLAFSARGNFSIGGSSDTVHFSGPQMQSTFRNIAGPGQLTTLGTVISAARYSVQPFIIPYDMVASNLRFGISVVLATAANNSLGYFDLSIYGGIYTRANTAGQVNSVVTFSSTATNNWNSNLTASIQGLNIITQSFAAQTFTAGEYWLAINVSTDNTATGGANTTALGNSVSMLLAGSVNSAFVGAKTLGGGTGAASGVIAGLGMQNGGGATAATFQMSTGSQTGVFAALAPVYFELRNQSWKAND